MTLHSDLGSSDGSKLMYATYPNTKFSPGMAQCYRYIDRLRWGIADWFNHIWNLEQKTVALTATHTLSRLLRAAATPRCRAKPRQLAGQNWRPQIVAFQSDATHVCWRSRPLYTMSTPDWLRVFTSSRLRRSKKMASKRIRPNACRRKVRIHK